MEKNLLLKISSNYNLKKIFSYEDYKFVLRLIKYNKAIQDKIGITLEDYKDQQDNFKYIQKYNYKYNHNTIKNFFNKEDNILFFLFIIYIILYGLSFIKTKVMLYIVIFFVFFGSDFLKDFSKRIFTTKAEIIGVKSSFLNALISFFLPTGLPKLFL